MHEHVDTLARTENGSAILCGCCGKVEVTLGNAMLTLQRDDFGSVLDVIAGFYPGAAPDSAERGFVIRTESGDGAYCFHRRELLELRELVVRAERALAPAGPALDGPRPRFDTRSLLN